MQVFVDGLRSEWRTLTSIVPSAYQHLHTVYNGIDRGWVPLDGCRRKYKSKPTSGKRNLPPPPCPIGDKATNDTHQEEDKSSMAKHIADLKQREAPILNATVQSDGDLIPLRGNRQEFNIPRFWVIVSWEGTLKCGRSVQIWVSTPTHVAFSVPCGATRGCQGDKSCTCCTLCYKLGVGSNDRQTCQLPVPVNRHTVLYDFSQNPPPSPCSDFCSFVTFSRP